MTRQRCAAILIISLSILASTISQRIGTKKFFGHHKCNLTKPARNDATSPSFSNIQSLRFIVSHRVSHELVTRAFAIFLREIMDFDRPIEFHTYNNSSWSKLYDPINIEDKHVELYSYWEVKNEQPTINLEFWQTAENREFLSDVVEGNSISTDTFRHGLYVPEQLTRKDEKITYKNFIANENGDGSYKRTYMNFDLKSDPHYAEFFKKINLKMEKVTKFGVVNGVYTPTYCNLTRTTEPCGIVLTSHYIDNYFFIRIIDALKLKLELYFMGDNLKQTISNLSKIIELNSPKKKNFLVLHWTPSEIIDGRQKFVTVEPPPCDEYRAINSNISCKFDANSVSAVWSKSLEEQSWLLAEILQNLKFKSLKPLLKIYDEKFNEKNIGTLLNIRREEFKDLGTNHVQDLDDIYDEIACNYMKKETDYYSPEINLYSWFVGEMKRNIKISGIYPPLNDSGEEYKGIVSVLNMAEKELKNTSIMKLLDIPESITISLNNDHINCLPDEALKSFISHFQEKSTTIGVLGPACSEAIEPIAIVSKHYKMSAITYSAEGISFADRSNYPYFFRTIGENSQYEDVFAKIFKLLKWDRIAAITEDGQKWTDYITRMAAKNNTFIIAKEEITREKDPQKQLESVDKLLKELKEKNRARIIICDIHDHLLMKPILCKASLMGMTADEGFVWFLPVYISLKMNETFSANDSCSREQMRKILKGHFALSYANLGNGNEVLPSNITRMEWKENYMRERKITAISPADYGPFVYDSIWVYVKALSQLIHEAPPSNETTKHWYIKNLDNKRTYDKLSEIIGKLSFTGVSGKIEFNSAGSRYINISILQWQNNDFKHVGTYQPIVNKDRSLVGGKLEWNKPYPVWWPKGVVPDDGRESCAMKFLADAFGIECSTVNSTFIGVLCVLIILACSGFSFLFWKRKYAKKLEKSAQIMMNYGRVVNGIELSRWEIPRENVILNRRIGEGAFGTVYGGEALINEDEGWTPVAIKTLKAGATAEARLDFLAESEIMKRFEHKNIVKLLAVCLQKEPLYMMCEFMLYGDLKTFLLARRHLVDDKIHDDNNEISPKRLTLMALDVARGLSYLASLNFVHRDIACRNCMINAQRICKIGDFGMARSTSDNDYYRFTRKGMLPVRWMAPESISAGLFSHASDIWSFGVFLYEIVTLGAFPFQGLTNNQVFDLVKSGSCVKLPTKCKPQLKALMSSCFSIDPKKRPGASTIVEFISSHPRMLTPCMDVPKPNLDEQVNLLGSNTDDLEFDQLAETRERSHTPAGTINVDFLRTSASSSALQNSRANQEFEYLDMKLPKRMNGIYNEYPDLTATLPTNGNYNPIEPLLHRRSEISKSTLSLLKQYVPMCSGKNRNRSPEECTTSI